MNSMNASFQKHFKFSDLCFSRVLGSFYRNALYFFLQKASRNSMCASLDDPKPLLQTKCFSVPNSLWAILNFHGYRSDRLRFSTLDLEINDQKCRRVEEVSTGAVSAKAFCNLGYSRLSQRGNYFYYCK